jgi:uncharacterized protein
MANTNSFTEVIKKGYSFQGETIKIGAAILDGNVIPEAGIFLPLKTMNRHGLIAGATGTGKTKSFQMIAEGPSDASVPVLLMDIKGDLSGIGAAGTSNDTIIKRYQTLKMEYKSRSYPVDLLTLSGQKGGKAQGNRFRIWTGASYENFGLKRYTGRGSCYDL